MRKKREKKKREKKNNPCFPNEVALSRGIFGTAQRKLQTERVSRSVIPDDIMSFRRRKKKKNINCVAVLGVIVREEKIAAKFSASMERRVLGVCFVKRRNFYRRINCGRFFSPSVVARARARAYRLSSTKDARSFFISLRQHNSRSGDG